MGDISHNGKLFGDYTKNPKKAASPQCSSTTTGSLVLCGDCEITGISVQLCHLLLMRGEKLPLGMDFTNRFIYHVEPIDRVCNEVVVSA